MFENFLNEKIVINGKAYTRKDIEKIKKDFPGKLGTYSFLPNTRAYILSQNCSFGEEYCDDVSIIVEYNTKTNKIVDLIVTGVCIPPFLASLSLKWKGITFSTPIGTVVEFSIAENKKVAVGDDGQVAFLWL